MAPMRRAACPSPGHLPSAQLRHARSRPRAAAGSRPCSTAHRRRATASPCGRAAPSDPTADAGPASAQVHGGRRGRSSGRSSRVRPASTHPSGALVSTTLRSARATSPAPTARAPASAAPGNSQAATVSGVSRAPTRHRRLRWPGSVADRRCGQSPVRPSAGSVRSDPGRDRPARQSRRDPARHLLTLRGGQMPGTASTGRWTDPPCFVSNARAADGFVRTARAIRRLGSPRLHPSHSSSSCSLVNAIRTSGSILPE